MNTDDLFRRVLAERPEVLDQLQRAHTAAWAAVDPQLLELCRGRMAMLLGSVEERPDDSEELARWSTSPRYGEVERACLAYTEQFVLDVASMDDETVERVSQVLGPEGLANFANALLVLEQRIRLRLIWTALLEPAA